MQAPGRHVCISFVTVLLLSTFQLSIHSSGESQSAKEQPIGWLGVSIQEVSEDLAERLAATFGVESGTGVLVVEVIRGGPAEAGGLKPNDVIVKLDAQPIWEVRQLQRIIRGCAPGRTVRLTVLRGKERVPVSVTIGQMPETVQGQLAGERLGFLVRSRPGAPEGKAVEGQVGKEDVQVVVVEPGSAAAEAGLRPQDILVKIGEHDIRSLEEMGNALKVGREAKLLKIQVVRDGKRQVLSLKIPPQDDVTEPR